MSTSHVADYWSLYRSLEKTIRDVEGARDAEGAIRVFLESLVNDYRTSLGITGGRLYRREIDEYVLTWKVVAAAVPEDRAAEVGYRIPASYAIVREVRQHGVVITDRTDPSFDQAIEGPLDVDTFAAIVVGTADDWLISFSLDPAAERSHVLYCLNTVRHVVDWRLHQSAVEGEIMRVQEIQRSVFPKEDPVFAGYEVYGCSRPSEAVGGDVYDFIALGRHLLGVLIADSSGHGLSAALQARDVVTGMRMGLEDDLKITHVVEKLNKVIHRTSLSSKFVSLFYGELDRHGNFVYCNAGHVPVLRFRRGVFTPLSKGGPVLGPSPEASYERGFTSMHSGDLLVLYTDGITEAHAPDGEEFGIDRLKQVIEREARKTTREIVDAVLGEVKRFAPDDPFLDDRTLVIVRRTAARRQRD